MKRIRENDQPTKTERQKKIKQKVRTEAFSPLSRIEEHQRSVRVTPSPENRQAAAEHIDPIPQQDLRALNALSMKSTPMPDGDMHQQTYSSIGAFPSRSVRITPSPENRQAAAEHIDPTTQHDLRAVSALSMKPTTPKTAEDMNPQTYRSIVALPSKGSFFDLSAMNKALEETLELETDYSETISTGEEEDYGLGLIID
ncbi:MAG: hypothetical protein VX737_06015 [Pseudomonadota bacterium]|nr:hypothetical protein [Pseudomonadota bacterium]